MDGHGYGITIDPGQHTTSLLKELNVTVEQGPCCGRAHGNDELRPHHKKLRLEPWTACANLVFARWHVNAPFP